MDMDRMDGLEALRRTRLTQTVSSCTTGAGCIPSRCPGSCWPFAHCKRGRPVPHSFDEGEDDAGQEPEDGWAVRRAAVRLRRRHVRSP